MHKYTYSNYWKVTYHYDSFSNLGPRRKVDTNLLGMHIFWINFQTSKKGRLNFFYLFSLSLIFSITKSPFSFFSLPTSSLCHFFFRIKAIITHFFSPLTSNYTFVWISLKNKNYFIIQLIFATMQLTFATIHGFHYTLWYYS